MPRRMSYVDVVFNEKRKRLLVPAIPDDLERDEIETAVMIFESGKWALFMLECTVRSIETFETMTWAAARDGEVLSMKQGETTQDRQQLPDSGFTDGRKL